jgi:tetratricopeptide (TPR) repeat protein
VKDKVLRLSAGHRKAAVRTLAAALLLQVSVLPAELTSQQAEAFDSLIEVPVPALEKFEQAIQDQLLEQRANLDGLASRSDAPRLELMEVYGKTGQLYFLYELNEAALSCFINARTLAPKDFRWHYYIGVVYTRGGDADRAIESLERALRLRPQSIPAHIRLGLLQLDRGDVDAAEQNFRAVLETNSDIAAAYHGLGMVALRRGDPEVAIQHLSKALELQPGATTIHQQLGLAYRELGDLDRARYHLQLNEHDLVMFPDPLVFQLTSLIRGGRFYIRLGNEALAEGRLAEAIRAFQEAVARNPEERLAHYNLGQALLQAGRPEEAIQELQRALEIDPGFRHSASRHASRKQRLTSSGLRRSTPRIVKPGCSGPWPWGEPAARVRLSSNSRPSAPSIQTMSGFS